MLIEFLVISVLIMVSGFFSTVELAILSVNRNKMSLKVEEGDKKSKLIIEIIEKSDIFLSTMAISRTTIWLFVGAYATQTLIEPVLYSLISDDMDSVESLQNIVVVVTIVILSYLILVFGEVVPKKIAINNPEKIAYLVIRPIFIFSKLCRPFVVVISVSSGFVLKILRVKQNREKEHITEEEIRMLIDAGGEIGNIDADEMQMINNVFEFNDKTAEEISTHRTDIISLDIKADIKEMVAVATNDKYSRIPVYEDNIDNVIGVLHIKDIMKYIVSNGDLSQSNVDIKGILRKPYFVPTSKKADELFEEMRNKKIQFSIVIDEYGGTVGIVTMEDLIEEIMGNIFDEYDGEEVVDIDELDKDTFIINGTTSLEDVSQYLDTQLPIDDYDTIGGFVIGQLGRIPADGEQPEIEFKGLIFKIKSVHEKRIQKIVVSRIAQNYE